ncbi:hypothetical protein AMAG_06622 [Allomyces macrogynus ATCC 38327]|uniref:Uncharacterized protein n=1 Tax=Allomyces macrogynus (strain ATCC 38327) TaxID=578462 RepID=A0A0L0SEI3_ALLM3|nr:hypothetical protein AMAG_06622 [Allomyces macrogynus ATCC 38327]|eukprot:KNE60857.1 hypothetical protein AMAG_06622 [Allomyces macrogynus ATCC 38327]
MCAAYGMPTPASSAHHEHPHAPSLRGAGSARKPLLPLFSPEAADENAWASSPAHSAAVMPEYASAPAPGFWGPAPAPVTAMPSRKRSRSPDTPRAAAVVPPPTSHGACMCADYRLAPRPALAAMVPPAMGARVSHGVIEFSTHP